MAMTVSAMHFLSEKFIIKCINTFNLIFGDILYRVFVLANPSAMVQSFIELFLKYYDL
jgi:hypothetical protein